MDLFWAGTNALGWETNSITRGSKEDQDNLTAANTCLYWLIMPIIYNLELNILTRFSFVSPY